MLRTDFNELKKALSPDLASIQEIWASYANMEKTVLFSSKKTMVSLTDEEQQVYSDIFKKVLSGKKGKNAFIMPLEEDNTKKDLMFSISKNQPEKDIQDFIDEIIEQYDAKDSFAVLVATGSYDVPSYASDGAKLDGYDETYKFFICAICPTKLAKPSVVYRHNSDFFEKAKRDYVLQPPTVGLLFPAFENRQSNVNKFVFYAKSTKDAASMHQELLSEMLESALPGTSEDQLGIYSEMVEESFGGSVELSQIKSISNAISEQVSAADLDGEELEFSNKDLSAILSDCGGEKLDPADNIELTPELFVTDKFVIQKGSDLVITASVEGMELIKEQVVDGKKCLVIPVADVTVNGINLG